MNKARLLDTLQAERARWEALLAQVGEARMTQAGMAGDWSVKDIIAHIAWHEREIAGVMQARAFVGSDLWELPQDERNAAVFQENRNRPLQEVLTESKEVFQRLLESLEPLSDDDLTSPDRFPPMPADSMPWQLVASNSYDHYPQHISSVQALLEKR